MRKYAWSLILDEQIEAGWGETPQDEIPTDWRTRRGPDKAVSKEHKLLQAAGMVKAHQRGQFNRGKAPQLPLFDWRPEISA